LSWSREFDDPNRCPKGEPLLTLKDAAEHFMKLPTKTSAREDRQFAMKMLIDAADRDGIVMLARIALLRAYRITANRPGDKATPGPMDIHYAPKSNAVLVRRGLDTWTKRCRAGCLDRNIFGLVLSRYEPPLRQDLGQGSRFSLPHSCLPWSCPRRRQCISYSWRRTLDHIDREALLAISFAIGIRLSKTIIEVFFDDWVRSEVAKK
jgi:hypothetical protein